MANEFKVKNGIIISGSAEIEQNLRVRGTLTADQYNVSIVSTSILYESGSTKFGDSLDDLHEFTGSVSITGSINLNGQSIGTGKLDETTFNSYTSSNTTNINAINIATGSLNSYTASNNSVLTSLQTSTGSLNSFTSSINTTIKSKLDNDGVISGSIQINITGTTGYSTFSSSIDSSINSLSSSVAVITSGLTSTITSLSSSVATTDLNQNNRLDSLESSSGSIRTNFNSFTSSYNTGSFTGSFIGNGSELFNIPASGVTGLQLNKIISGNASASIDNTGLYVNRNVYIDGTLSAKELNITLVSSSVLFESGSSKFGDTSNDTHQFTGSILISGSILSTSTALVSGSSQIVYSGLTGIPSGIVSGSEQLTGSYDTRYVLSGSITQTTWDNIANKPNDIVSSSNQISTFGFLQTSSFNTYTSSNDGRVSSLESFTASLNTNYVSETEFGTYTGSINNFTSSTDSRLTSVENATFGLSGSFATTLNNSFVGTQKMTGSLIVSNSLNVIGTQNVTGSLIVSNSLKVIGTEQVTGSLLVSGSVVISGSLDISNANVGSSRYLHTQTSTSATWSITHNLGYDYPNVTVYDGSNNKVMLPADVTSVNQNTTQVTFATPEYGYALVSVGGVTTATADRYLHTVSSATGSWVINHNFNYKYVNIDVYDNNDEQLIPQKVTAVSANTVQVDFATPTSGNAIITTGGPRSTTIFNQTGSFYNTQNNIGITGSLVVTGDVDASNFNTTSDKLIKTNIEKIEGALDKIEKLNGYTFNWLEEYNEDRTRQIGLLANEVNEVQPELTTERVITLGDQQQKILLLDYSKVTALLIEAVKELNDKVKKLENKRKKK